MWISTEDAARYEKLTDLLRGLLHRERAQQTDERVSPEDLAVYLEWLELGREGAASIRPFIDKSSPYLLGKLSYADLEHDFDWLSSQLTDHPEELAPAAGFAINIAWAPTAAGLK